jgi:hypothetical protein
MVITRFASGQEILSNNPPMPWYQVNTSHFRVLFPAGFDTQATRMANTLEHLHAAEAQSLGSRPRKISVLLQNQSAVSNGFVSMFPRRSEFYTMPPQDYNFLGTNDWLNMLATHEYRHIVQYQHATRGFNRVIYYLFGAPTFAAFSQIAAPQWFWEGDAVATETAFTSSGRGRIPRFALAFKTNLLEGRTFNYHKQYLRSYKHFIPDHYVLGYHMVSYLRKKTDDADIYGDITARSWTVPFVPFAFSNAMKNKTGLFVTGLYKEMASTLKTEWKNEIDQLQLTPFESITNRNNNAYTDYLYPQPQGDGSVIAMKNGMGDIDQFVRLQDGVEEKFFTPGFVNDSGMLSAHLNVVVWNEFGYHPRWRMKNYSQLKLYDFENRKKRIIGERKGRLGSAALSPSGDRICAIRSDNDYRNILVIFEFFTGKPIQELEAGENTFFAMPRWSDKGDKIALLKITPAGKTITLVDVNANTSEDVFQPSIENFGHPVLVGEYLFFNSPISGIDNIYVYDLARRKRFQVTVSKYGAYNPAISSDKKFIYYNDQTRNGLDVVRIPFDPTAWKEYVSVEAGPELYDHLSEQEHRPHLLDSVPQHDLSVAKYSKLKGIINPYSWGLNVNNDLTRINFGIASRDLLSTTTINAGYSYDINERTGLLRASVSYQGLYPIIDLAAETGDRETAKTVSSYSVNFKWRETSIEGGLRLPLLLTRSKYVQQLSIGCSIGLTKTTSFENTISRDGTIVYRGPGRIGPELLTPEPEKDTVVFLYKDQLSNGNLWYNHVSFSYDHLLKTSYRDFLYRWGQSFDADLYHTPFSGDFEGRLWSIRSALYFPGLFKHHYLYFRGAHQEREQGIATNLYTFRNTIPKPRGYGYPADETFTSFSANYALPLWYPDIALGPVLNIQRIKANLFLDYGIGSGQDYFYVTTSNEVYTRATDATYQSFGVETTVDFNLMRFLPKFEMGVRASYIKANRYHNSGTVFEILIGNIGF